MKKKILLKVLVATIVTASGILGTNQIKTNAAPIQDAQIQLTQPDGQAFQCFASGDEFYNYIHDSKGRAIIKDEKTGYYVYGKYVNDKVIPSRERVTKENINILQNIQSDSRVNISEVTLPEEEIQKQRDLFQAAESVQGSTKNIGKLNNVVVFIKFSDQADISRGISTYERQFNSQNQVSLSNYYKEASYNQLDINTTFYPKPQGEKVLSYTDSHPRSYYSNVPSNERANREQTLLANAINSVKSQIPKDLNIDSDNDGKVDNVCFIIKGGSNEWSSLLWPHKWSMFAQHPEINGKRVDTYNFQLEEFIGDNGVAVLCHEMFHTLGAPDLYHYNSSNKITSVGPWDIMDNSYPNPQVSTYMKMYYGKWINKMSEIDKPGRYSIKSIKNSSNNSYIIKSPNSKSEYFVVEYRKKEGLYESKLPGQGLLVYRINTAYAGRGNASSNSTAQDEVYLYRPSGTLSNNGYINNAALGSTKTSISSSELFLSNGADSGISLKNINFSNDTANFDVVINGKEGNEDPYKGKKFDFTFKGYADNIFAELGLDIANKNARIDIKGIVPHSYFSDSYASVLIRDAEGSTVYSKDFIGTSKNTAKTENIAIKSGYYITIKHREPNNRLSIVNMDNNSYLEKSGDITYKITDTGLIKVSGDVITKLPLKSLVNFDDTKIITGDLEITGECVSGKKITNIQIDIDNTKYTNATFSKLDDSQNKYLGYDLSNAAFRIKLSYSNINNGSHSYKIIATTEDGVKNILKQGSFTIKKETSGGGSEQTNQWKSGVSYKIGDVVEYNGINYKCIQAHRSIRSWEPSVAISLWSKVIKR